MYTNAEENLEKMMKWWTVLKKNSQSTQGASPKASRQKYSRFRGLLEFGVPTIVKNAGHKFLAKESFYS